ncbi:hypothetical protein [Parasphingopyxis sp.]|uniref:hypothetical protein n=1 Tax=Parasphingopyxis sp. TaxID=1920299 RepID=UPI0026212107|nr:hypothetical protein [Parasphingopyxis sp.]
MDGFVGDPIQQVMVRYGPPANAFDMPDGTRAFQWVMDRSYVTPTYQSNTGSATAIGNSVYWSQNTQISGGQPINHRCAYTMYGRWDDNLETWVMTGFERPPLACE